MTQRDNKDCNVYANFEILTLSRYYHERNFGECFERNIVIRNHVATQNILVLLNGYRRLALDDSDCTLQKLFFLFLTAKSQEITHFFLLKSSCYRKLEMC